MTIPTQATAITIVFDGENTVYQFLLNNRAHFHSFMGDVRI